MENEKKANNGKIIFITAIICIVLCIPIGIILGKTLLGKNDKTNTNEINNANNTQNIDSDEKILINGEYYFRSEVVSDINEIDDKLNGFSFDDLNNVDVYGDDGWNNDSQKLNRYDLLLRMSISDENYLYNLIKFVLLKMNVAKGQLNKKYMNFNISISELINILNRYSKITISKNDLDGFIITDGNSIKCDSKECNIYNPGSFPTVLLNSGNIIMSKKIQNTTVELGYVYFWGDDNSCKYYKNFKQTKLLKEIDTDVDILGLYTYCKNNYNSNEYTTIIFDFESNDLGGYRLSNIEEKTKQ